MSGFFSKDRESKGPNGVEPSSGVASEFPMGLRTGRKGMEGEVQSAGGALEVEGWSDEPRGGVDGRPISRAHGDHA